MTADGHGGTRKGAMVFALDKDSGELLALASATEAPDHCKPVDVRDGYWLFFADDGSPLPGYGAQIWLFGKRHGLPEGTLAALGNRGQYVVVVPARGLVIVRRGFDAPGARFAIHTFAADVLKAVPPAR